MASQEDYLDNLLNDMIKETVSTVDDSLTEEVLREESLEDVIAVDTEGASGLEISELADLVEMEEVAETFAWDDLVEEESEADLDVNQPNGNEPNEDSVYLDAVSSMTEEGPPSCQHTLW